MATKKPRITITLEPEVYETVRRLSELQGRAGLGTSTMSGVISELVESVHPPLMRTVALLEAASDAPEQVRQGIRGVVEGVYNDVAENAGDGIRQMDFLLEQLQASSGGRPPPSNTGVRSPTERGSKAPK